MTVYPTILLSSYGGAPFPSGLKNRLKPMKMVTVSQKRFGHMTDTWKHMTAHETAGVPMIVLDISSFLIERALN